MWSRWLGIGGIVVMLGMLGTPAAAQDADDEAPPADPELIAATLELYMNEFSNADLDGDGNADFADTDGDGIPDIPQGEPGDLDLRPGDGRFGTEVSALVQGLINDITAELDDGSTLLYDCGGMAISYDSDGSMVDWALGIGSSEGGGPTGQLIDLYPPSDVGERAFTKSNPFVVKDTVVYFGRMPGQGDGARNHTWSISTGPISLDEGGDDNPDGNNRNAGEVNISDDVPGGSAVFPTGIFPVSGELDSENGVRCEGSGWFKLETGFPLFNVAGGVGTVMVGAAILGLLFNSRPAITWKA